MEFETRVLEIRIGIFIKVYVLCIYNTRSVALAFLFWDFFLSFFLFCLGSLNVVQLLKFLVQLYNITKI